jgi:hypothetical protein
LAKEHWEVFIPDHHQGYITWETYEKNHKQLLNNRTNIETSGAAREGLALLQGLIICGKCGRRMTVRYTGNGGISPIYECKGKWEHGTRATCTTVPASVIDKAISTRFLQAMQPAELELSIQVLIDYFTQRMTDKSWKLSLEGQFDAERAERQYQLAEPENRLVVRNLEMR